jgi:hypothetical protein
MSASTPAKKSDKSKKTGPAGLPDERVWIKYSPHNELPISVSSSLFIHVVVLGVIGLILAGFLGRLFGPPDHQPEVFAAAEGGGGGAGGDSDVTSPGSAPREVIEKAPPADHTQPVEPKELTPPTREAQPIVTETNDIDRLIDQMDTPLAKSRLSQVAAEADKRLAAIAMASKGTGPGTGGGVGTGSGTGVGDGSGSGSGRIATREKRQNRWTLLFRTQNGGDYLRQLSGLGAVLAIADKGEDLMVFRDLNQRPVPGKVEPASNLSNQIRWTDDRPDSVHSLAQTMGMQTMPQYIHAFFPTTLEEDLRKKEMTHYKGNEDDIIETLFRIEWTNGRYEPVVVRIQKKKR